MTASLAYAWLGQLGLISIAAWLILAILWPVDRKPRAARGDADNDTEG